MKPALFLLLILISLCLSFIKNVYCPVGYSMVGIIHYNPPFYNIQLECASNDSLQYIGKEYKVYKTCGDNEEPHCFQNNILSPELYCECRTKK